MKGFVVQNFTDSNSPAFNAGILENDAIYACNDIDLDSVDHLINIMKDSDSQENCLSLLRGSNLIKVVIKADRLGAVLAPKDISEQFSRAQREQERKAREAKYNGDYSHIILSTTPSLDGYRVTETVDVITAECAFGMNVFKDIFSAVTDFFGGRSGAVQNTLRDARKLCLNELRKEAFDIGADAVIGVDLDYSEFTGREKSMLFMVASGTAVKLSKEND
jgi:uncharacterized protein YbjQ (UPF0145 family)